MKGWTSKNCTSTPMRRPTKAPASRTTGRAIASEVPASSSFASQIPVNAITEPTERSMPPVTMTNVMPTARISR